MESEEEGLSRITSRFRAGTTGRMVVPSSGRGDTKGGSGLKEGS